jgi:iron complex transport system substrate-binding protein
MSSTRRPRRIVSLSASNTEILCALGLGEQLVGVDTWSDYPPAVKALPKVGRELDIDVAAVAALRPDLVAACLSVPGMERNIPRLEAAGLPYVAVAPVGLESIFDNIRQLGEATGRQEQAADLVDRLQGRLEAVRQQMATVAGRPSVYWEWWPQPLVAAAGGSWMTSIIAMAGGDNVFADREEESATVQVEEVLARRPEVIVACWCGARTPPTAQRVAGRPGWEPSLAVQSGRVHVVPEAYFARPGPRLADGLELLAALLHPAKAGEGAAHA